MPIIIEQGTSVVVAYDDNSASSFSVSNPDIVDGILSEDGTELTLFGSLPGEGLLSVSTINGLDQDRIVVNPPEAPEALAALSARVSGNSIEPEWEFSESGALAQGIRLQVRLGTPGDGGVDWIKDLRVPRSTTDKTIIGFAEDARMVVRATPYTLASEGPHTEIEVSTLGASGVVGVAGVTFNESTHILAIQSAMAGLNLDDTYEVRFSQGLFSRTVTVQIRVSGQNLVNTVNGVTSVTLWPVWPDEALTIRASVQKGEPRRRDQRAVDQSHCIAQGKGAGVRPGQPALPGWSAADPGDHRPIASQSHAEGADDLRHAA